MILLVVSCQKQETTIKSSGSFALDGTSYSITSFRVDHVDYADGDSLRFVLKITAKGYSSQVTLYLIAPDNDLMAGNTYNVLMADSLSSIMLLKDGDTTSTACVTAAEVTVSALDDEIAAGKNWLSYEFSLTVEGTQTTGSFVGPHTVNYTVDQPSFGQLAFDTLQVGLSRPSLYGWGTMFTDISNYFELKFYSSDARFSDNGVIRQGVQFVVGLHSFQALYPAVGAYPVSLEAEEATAFYGHKEGSVNWGTYWQVFSSSSVIGKANILSDTVYVVKFTADSLTLKIALHDQLGNDVVGWYDGEYY